MPIIFRDVHFTYSPKAPTSFEALKGINLTIEDGSFTAIIGRTGCGKSTLVQHINALLRPSSGEVAVNEFVNYPVKGKKAKGKELKDLRKNVGLVFQFPEYQLFEETVIRDVCYGPKNFGMSKEEALEKSKKALEEVGLDETFYERSPFELSGGEKRRVAIAGILAIAPKYLIVDEPTAGLDPIGAETMMNLFKKIHDAGTTIVLVTHDMNLVLRYCDHVIVMDNGQIAMETTPEHLFSESIERFSLETPLLYKTIQDLQAKGINLNPNKIRSIPELAEAIAKERHHG